MTDRPQGSPHPGQAPVDGPTRDIRLPPGGLAHVPAAWAGAARDEVHVHRHEPPLQEQPVRELPAPAPAPPTTVAAVAAADAAAPAPSPPPSAPPVELPPVVSSPAVDPDPTIVVPPVGRWPQQAAVPELPTDRMRPENAPRDHTRPFVPPAGRASPGARDRPPPEQPVRADRDGAARAPAERGGTRAWTWVLLVVLPLLVIAGAGVLLFLLLGG